MSFPKKGSRVVEAGGERYRWLIRRKPTYAQGLQGVMTMAIEAVDEDRGGVLHVRLGVSRPDNWIAPHQRRR